MSTVSLQKLNDYINTISITMNPKYNEKPNQISNNDNLRTTPNCNDVNERKIVHELLLSEESVVKKLTIEEGRFGMKIVNITLEILPNNDESQLQEGVIEQVAHNTRRQSKFKQESELKSKKRQQESELKSKKRRTSNNNKSHNSLSCCPKESVILPNDNEYKQFHIEVKETKSLEKTKNIPILKKILQPDNAKKNLQHKAVTGGKILTNTVSPELYSQYAAQTQKELGTMISSLPRTVETNNSNKTNMHNKYELMTRLLMNPHITVTLNKNKNNILYPDGQTSNTDALNINVTPRYGEKSINKSSEIITNEIIQQKQQKNISPKRKSVVAELKKNSCNLPTQDQMKTRNLRITNFGSTDHNQAQNSLELDNSNKTPGDNTHYPRRHSNIARMFFVNKIEMAINKNMHANV